MDTTFGAAYLADVADQFRRLKTLADKALAQTTDEELFVRLDEESNSLATIMKHLAGNMESRWTDFLTSDGEKPDRQRDREFELEPADTRRSLTEAWESGWRCALEGLASVGVSDLGRDVFIRSERHSVIQAIDRQLSHTAYHVGQIVFLAKHFRFSAWQTLSIARGQSDAFNREMAEKTRR